MTKSIIPIGTNDFDPFIEKLIDAVNVQEENLYERGLIPGRLILGKSTAYNLLRVIKAQNDLYSRGPLKVLSYDVAIDEDTDYRVSLAPAFSFMTKDTFMSEAQLGAREEPEDA